MRLEEIQLIAEKDLEIDQSNLTKTSIDTPLMINKYYTILIEEGRILKALDTRLSLLYKEKYDYYLGLADPKVYVDRPLGRKILKSDVDMWITADTDYISHINKIETQKYKVRYVEEIIKQFNNRTFLIKNIIEFEKFKNGGF